MLGWLTINRIFFKRRTSVDNAIIIPMEMDNLRAYRNYRWIVLDPKMLGGKPSIRGTRLSASLLLSCLSEGMSAEEIEDSYGPFPHDAIPEVLWIPGCF
jgi:uncharacterized protein (DUF433 family)